MTPEPLPEADGLLLSRDLIFTAKITGTAEALGHRLLVVGDPARATAWLSAWRPRAVFIDLAAGDLVRPATLKALKALVADVPFVAFGSHVETAVLADAAAAGCDPVLPRSRFVAELPTLIRRYLATSSVEND